MRPEEVLEMPVDFASDVIAILPNTVGLFEATGTVTFSSPVLRAEVVINGWQARYDSGARLFANLEVNTGIDGLPAGNNVDYKVRVELADFTGGESWNGFIALVVIVDRQ